MIPIIALVGRSNVGKSTIFNRLTCTKDALVTKLPGLTRDRNYGYVTWKGYEFVIIDTSGITNSKEKIDICMINQSLKAIKEADIVLLIVDGHTGLVPIDQDIVNYLRNHQKKFIVVVNKIDNISNKFILEDFYSLGLKKIFSISASHGLGINNLLRYVLLIMIKNKIQKSSQKTLEIKNKFTNNKKNILTKNKEKIFFDSQSSFIKVVIVGSPNVGKSTLVNCISGENRMIVSDIPGTTRDNIYIPVIYNKQKYIFIDTAGIRKRNKIVEITEKISITKTLKTIEDTNSVVLLILDVQKEGVISNQNLSLLNFILDCGRSLVIAVNKLDCLSVKTYKETKKIINQRLKFINFIHINFISALYNRGISTLFKSINEAYKCANNRVCTTELNKIMYAALKKHQPPIINNGKRTKLKYAHIGGYNPPTIIIHGTKVKHLPDNYKRYLMSHFRNSLKIKGTPIKICFNEIFNPFTYRCNFSEQKIKKHKTIKYKKLMK